MDIEKIKIIVELTKAKVDILKLKADDYTWACHVDKDTKDQLEETLIDINEQLSGLRSNARINGRRLRRAVNAGVRW